MTPKEITQLTDQELIEKAKKAKYSSITMALFIGMLAGIIFYSIIKNSWGFLTLIPLYFIFKAIDTSKEQKAVEKEMQSRNLK